MRVCLVSEDFAPNPGGMATHVYELARALTRIGHDVSVFGAHNAKYNHFTNRLDLNDLGFVSNLSIQSGPLSRMQLIFRQLRLIREQNDKKPFDVVHWHCLFYESVLMRLLRNSIRAGFVFTNHSSGFLRRAKSPVWRRVMAHLISTADVVITPSEELRDETGKLGLRDTPIYMIANGVDTEVFKPRENQDFIPVIRGLEAASTVGICARRLVHKNGVDLAIRAWRHVVNQYPKAVLLVVGDGPEKPALSDLVADLALNRNVVMLGNVDRSEMPGLYALADFAIMPSRMEAVSIAALEAMATGLPVVATSVGGLPQIVKPNETGVLVEPESPEGLSHGILYLLASEERREVLGRGARAMVENLYSWDAVAERTASAYETAIKRSGIRQS